MPKCLHLFGKYLRDKPFPVRHFLRNDQFVRPIPVKAYGRAPTAPSQTGLYHDEDYNFYSKVTKRVVTVRRRLLRPYVLRKHLHSPLLNWTFRHLRVTRTALDAMDRVGGFDQYILRTSPEELRSTFGMKLRELMHYYMQNPEVKAWRVPPRIFMRKDAKRDPWYARHVYHQRKALFRRALAKHYRKHSPFYLPSSSHMAPERQPFAEGVTPEPLTLWWNSSPQLEHAFRRRLGKAHGLEKPKASTRVPHSFYSGHARGGGGRHNKPKTDKEKLQRRALFQ